MHVLLTNDDGPPNDLTSPYIKSFVDAILKYTDWQLSIVVPSQQRSWIGKAHFAGKDLTASFIYSKKNQPLDNSYLGPFPLENKLLQKDENLTEWCLIDGTPASCTDLGIHHVYKNSRPKVDLVLSGPNFGRNSTAVYIMASGTIGASMEAALAGTKAIGVSYAFESKDIDLPVLEKASELSIAIIKHLYANWNEETDLYSINVPLIPSILDSNKTKILYAPILENRWGSIFTSVGDASKSGFKEDADYEKIKNNNEQSNATDIVDESVLQKIQFRWDPDFDSVHKGVARSSGINDGKVIHDGNISVTPLKAIFKGVESVSGELKLDEISRKKENSANAIVLSIPKTSYVYPILIETISKTIPEFEIYESLDEIKNENSKIFHYGDYENLDFDKMMMNGKNYLACSYIYRKALIRKHYLAHTVHSYSLKNPTSILPKSFPKTYQLELDYAEFLDEALDDCYELRDDVLENPDKLWILKPSMSDKGQGIRIFKNLDQLQEIFNSYEDEEDDDEEEEEEEEEIRDDNHTAFGNGGSSNNDGNGIITSQLRHFVIQEYIDKPLLITNYGYRKFHIRSYVVCSGSLKVYLYKKMLMLFSKDQYESSNEEDEIMSLVGHLTNTCLQDEIKSDNVPDSEKTVEEFWSSNLQQVEKQKIFKNISEILSEVFLAAVSVDKFNFQPIPNAFEIYGIDFLVDENLNCYLLEVNSYPDFKQTGEDLKTVISGLFEGVVDKCVVPFLMGKPTKDDKDGNMIKVLDIDTSGAW
ncbi:hypothetical protein PACTADRAFT_52014 [Pachysolen tannophilus NRRL Y-2460]|uniref:Survival protein SurE-like phosphatase/nucleotidase domain-containing protein n=1 Tax=Pachysolen tannophilus NRRL Y-2460 TaxID=669874 RepID=A0A1E4TNX5_PACTA|nr:hypothetical protein PACTADRAFT_52014 [Pachysolen tannophilus NRRL Y-2460]